MSVTTSTCRSLTSHTVNKEVPQPQYRDLPSHRQDTPSSPVPTERASTPEYISPVGTHSPVSPPQPGNPPPSLSRVISSRAKSAMVPARPWPPAPLAPGVDPKAPRTANKVFDAVVARMLTSAQHEFECLLVVEDAYPGIDTQIRWSMECWEIVCSDTKCYYELSREMMSLVCYCVTLPSLI